MCAPQHCPPPSCWQQAGAAQDRDAACRLTSQRMEGLGWEHPELSAPKGPQESLEQGQRRSQPQGGGLGVGRRGMPPPSPTASCRTLPSRVSPPPPPHTLASGGAPAASPHLWLLVPTSMHRYSQPVLRPGASPLDEQADGCGTSLVARGGAGAQRRGLFSILAADEGDGTIPPQEATGRSGVGGVLPFLSWGCGRGSIQGPRYSP